MRRVLLYALLIICVASAGARADETCGNTSAAQMSAYCGSCWIVSIAFVSQFYPPTPSAFQGMIAQYACMRWASWGYYDYGPTCQCPTSCTGSCYQTWDIPFQRVKCVMDNMGFTTFSHNDKIDPADLCTGCNAGKTYLAGLGIGHTVAIVGASINSSGGYTLYVNDVLNEFMWVAYSELIKSWNSGTIEVSAWSYSSDWDEYVSIDHIDSFAAT